MVDNNGNAALTGIIPFSYFGGLNRAVGSTQLRVDGIVNNAADFKIWKNGHKYDNLIFQKVYWKEMMEAFAGPKILDLCDPDWLAGPLNIIETGSLADAITCSSENLTELLKSYFPEKIVCHVPDRLDFRLFPIAKENRNMPVKRLVWFGFIHNAHETLKVMEPVIRSHRLELTLISDKPYSQNDLVLKLQPRHIPYNQVTAFQLIQNHDIVLNPRSTKAIYKYKSNNKSIISWKLGLPVAETAEDLIRLLDYHQRKEQVDEKQQLVEQEYNVLKSAEQYRSIIRLIQRENKTRLALSTT